jgi:molybdopterin-guanine dinucleotide biosynthesis protein A
MLDVESFILVGGASSRMGSDKAQLRFGAQTGVERIAANLQSLAWRVRLVGSHEGLDAAGFENVPDLLELWGALGGIYSAFQASEAEWIVVVACDLPLVTDALFKRLWNFVDDSFDAIVPIQSDGRPQPLCAIYRPKTVGSDLARLIEAGEHTPRAFLAQIRTRWVSSQELSDLAGSEDFFLNVNTPGDYKIARRILEQRERGA